ncbi:hypothetical protein MCETHM1_00169 [Flavobacteriaceae bacterium]
MKTKNKFSKFLPVYALTLVGFLAFTSCNDDDAPAPVNEEELITTITAIYTPVGGGSVVTLQYKDLDGDGPGAPVKTVSGPFEPNKTYNGVVTFRNESVSPAEDLTAEVKEEGDAHQVFYQKTGTLNAFTYRTAASNLDKNGKPIGLESVFTTIGVAGGTLKITLKHEPNKSAAGVSSGDITNAGGATDAEAEFAITVAGIK